MCWSFTVWKRMLPEPYIAYFEPCRQFRVSYATRKERNCFGTVRMDLTADHSVNVTSLIVVVVLVVFFACMYLLLLNDWLLLLLRLYSFVWADRLLPQLHYLWCTELISRWNSWWALCWCCSVKNLVKLYSFLWCLPFCSLSVLVHEDPVSRRTFNFNHKSLGNSLCLLLLLTKRREILYSRLLSCSLRELSFDLHFTWTHQAW